MRKLTLDLDELRVESFDTAEETPTLRGTVEAREWTAGELTCWGDSCLDHSCNCASWETCWLSECIC